MKEQGPAGGMHAWIKAGCGKNGMHACECAQSSIVPALRKESMHAACAVKCSFLELYNEESTDLLALGEAADAKLKMLEDAGRVVVQVMGGVI